MTDYLKDIIQIQLERYSVKLYNLHRELKTIKALSFAIDRNMEIYKRLYEEKQISNQDKT